MDDDKTPLLVLLGMALLFVGAMGLCAHTDQVGIALFGDVTQSIAVKSDPLMSAATFLLAAVLVAVVAGAGLGGGRNNAK
jgi:hypothetical protein